MVGNMHKKELYHLSRKDEEYLLCFCGDRKSFDGLKEEGRGATLTVRKSPVVFC